MKNFNNGKEMFEIIAVRCHKARKSYICPDGIIVPGQKYYRGFAKYNRIEPFEFFFTNETFMEERKVLKSYLKCSLLLKYKGRRHLN